MTEVSASAPPPEVSAPTPDREHRFIDLYGFRFRLWPIVAAAILMQALLLLGREPARWIWHQGPADWAHRPWIFVGLATAFQAIVGVAAILAMRRSLPLADTHFRLPKKGRSLAAIAVLVGIGMALVMLVADYWPQIIAGTAPSDYPLDPVDSTGWLAAMGISGFAEEPIFRGFLIGGLAVLVPGRLRVGKVDLPVAAYIVALLFGLAHYQSFMVQPFPMAAAQQTYAFAWGLAYAWLMERSNSLVAPIIAHSFGDVLEVGLVMLWAAASS